VNSSSTVAILQQVLLRPFHQQEITSRPADVVLPVHLHLFGVVVLVVEAGIERLSLPGLLQILDELPPFFDYAVTQAVGAGNLAQVATAAFANLFSAALKLPRVCIVLSNLSGAYEGASKELRKAIK
jgi:hypothetical protein